jgi:hypothetical protein
MRTPHWWGMSIGETKRSSTMPGKIITAAAVILLGSTAFASAQTLAFPRDRAYVDGYGWSYGDTGPSYDPHYRVMPAPFGGGYGGYYDYAPGYGYDYAPGYPGWDGGNDSDW